VTAWILISAGLAMLAAGCYAANKGLDSSAIQGFVVGAAFTCLGVALL